MEHNRPLLKRYYRLVLVGILLLSFGLRLYRLGYQSLRGDEGATYTYSARPLAGLSEIMSTDPHPPLYYLLMHGWIGLGGDTEFALRFSSVIAGVLLVASLSALGRLLFDVRLGATAAFLVAVNPYHVFYAQDARSYPLVTWLGLLSTISLWQAVQHGRRRDWIAYGVIIAAAMYTHYYVVFIVAFQGLFVIWDGWRRRRFPWPYSVVGTIVALLYLPWYLFSWRLVTGYGGFGETVGMVASIWRPLLAFAGGQWLTPSAAEVSGMMALPLLGLGAIGLWRKCRPAAWLTVLYLAAPLLCVYIVSLSRPIFNERYLIIASPAFFLLIGAGLVWAFDARYRWLSATSFALVLALLTTGGLALSNTYFDPRFAKSPPWRDVLDYIVRKAHPGDALIYTAPLPSIVYYNEDRLPAYLIPYKAEDPLPKAVKRLEQVLNDHPRVWLVPAAPGDQVVPNQIEPWLDRHSARLDQTFFRILHIGLYESPATFLSTMTPQSARFKDGIQLDGFRIAGEESLPLTMRPGDTLHLTLMWRAERRPTLAYTVFTHIAGPDGRLWGQWDNPPVWGTYPTADWVAGETVFDQYLIPLQEDMPPGEYQLLIGLYDPVTGARLPVFDDKGEPNGDHVRLDKEITVLCKDNNTSE